MKENVFEVLIYLFENYMFEENGSEPDHETLTLELRKAGFGNAMIDRAFNWLDNLTGMNDPTVVRNPPDSVGSIRHYSSDELKCLDLEARGLLLRLEQGGVLNGTTREMVIDQLIALGVDQVETDHLKWVILMVLSNYAEGEGACEMTELPDLDGTGFHLN